MAGLISSLHNSSAALRVHSKGLEVTGKNLANVNNRGYSKERVEIGDRGQINTGVATESMGVEAMGLRQNRDALLDKGVMRELTATADLEAAKKVLTSAETALGQFLDRTKDSTSIQNAMGASGGAIGDALTDFFNAWESFSVKPNDIGEKQLLIAKAQILAEKISKTDERLAGVQSDVDSQVAVDVDVVNQILGEIAEINGYIAKAELVKPYSAVDLRDKRQAKMEELSKYVDVTFSNFDPDPVKNIGRISVELKNGVKLVNGEVVDKKLSYNANTNVLSVGESPFSIDALPSGKIGAQIKAAYDTVQDTRDNIKDLAEKLTDEVNGVYQDKGGVGDIFSLATSSTGLLKLNYNTSVALKAGSSGGNSIALSVAELGTKIFSETDKQVFDADADHGFVNGDKIYKTPDGELLWFAPSIPTATREKIIQEFGIVASPYIVETDGGKDFLLKTGANPPVYLSSDDVSSSIEKILDATLRPETSFTAKTENLILADKFTIGNSGDFSDGDEIQFTNLPQGSNLLEKTVYRLKHNAGDSPNVFTIEATNGDILRIRSTGDIDTITTKAAKVGLSNLEASIAPKLDTYPWSPGFYGEFTLGGINPNDFEVGDKFQFTNLPLNSGLNETNVYVIKSKNNNTIQIKSFDNAPLSVNTSDIQSGTKIQFLDKTVSSPAVNISYTNKNESLFYGEFTLGSAAGFQVGDQIKLTGLPSGSSLSANAVYKIASLNGNTVIIEDQDGNSLSTKLSDVNSSTKIRFANPETITVEESVDFEGRSRGIDGSFASYFNSVVTSVAQELNNTNTRLEDQKLSEEMAVNSRDQFSGVSQDEEITDMMKFQRSFQASARHINVIDTLLEQVVNRLGVG
jgi:flagellar hook-associated protein 1 FlgK